MIRAIPMLSITCALFASTFSANAQTPRIALKGASSAVFSIAFSTDGKILLAGCRDGAVVTWNVADGSERGVHHVLKLDVNTIAVSPDGRWVAAGGGDNSNTIQLYSVERKQLERPLDGHSKGVTALAFRFDGAYLASASFDHTVKVWDLKTRTVVRTIKGHLVNGESRPVNADAYSRDGLSIASGGNDGFVRLWDVQTGKEKAAFETKVAVDAIAFSPDGTQLAAAGGPGRKIRVWELASGRELHALSGHTAGVTSVCFSPDGAQIASGSQDKTVRLWNAKTGQETAILEGNEQTVNCVSFSPDGKTLASGSSDRSVRLWNMTPRK